MTVTIINCQPDLHGEQILSIFNYHILHTTALYDYHPRSLEMVKEWFAIKEKKSYPIFGAINENNNFLGFATYGSFRERDANKYTVEHSIYVNQQYQAQGIGKLLMQHLIQSAIKQNYHVMVGAVDATNVSSIKFHENLGFTQCGLIKQVGYKFNQWLDLAFYQLILPTPASPQGDF